MDKIICPSCGKPNPEWASTCQFCQAKLSVQQAPDWLSDLRSESQPRPGSQPPPGEETPGAVPDWLQRIRQRSQSEGNTGSLGTPPKPVDVPDWVRQLEKDTGSLKNKSGQDRIRQLDEARRKSGAVPEIKPAVEDWSADSKDDDTEDFLQKLSSWQAGVGGGASIEPPVSSTPSGEDAEDWLKGLEQWQPSGAPAGVPPSQPQPDAWRDLRPPEPEPVSPEPPPQPPAASGDEVPDWLAAFQTAGEESTGVTDWLNQLNQMQQPDEEEIIPLPPPPVSAPTPAAEPASEEMPDWLRAYQPPAGEQPASVPAAEIPGEPAPATGSELPDWLSGYQPPAEEPAAEKPQPAVPGLDDWMASLGEEKPIIDETPPQPAAPQEALPDWMASIQAEEPTIELPKPTGLTGWLNQLEKPGEAAAEPPPAVPAEPTAEAPAPAEELPDWMASLQTEGGAEEPTVELPKPTGLTGWLNQLEKPGEAAAEPPPAVAAEPPAEAPAPAEELPDWLSQIAEPGTPPSEAPAPAEELPDWMSQLTEAGTPPAAPEAAAEAPEPVPAEELPDWMSQLAEAGTPPAAPEAAAEAPEPVPAEELPDWMSQLAEAGTPPATPEAAAESATEELPLAAEMPDWMSQLESAGGAEEPTAELPQPTGMTGWLNQLEKTEAEAGAAETLPPAEAVETPAAAEELPPAPPMPDWLSQLEQQTAAEEPAVELPQPTGLTGWLSQLEQSRPAEETPPEAETAVAAGITDWLGKTGIEEPPPPPPEPEPVPSTEVPDWLKGLGEVTPPPEAGVLATEGADQQLPDWLASEPTKPPLPTVRPPEGETAPSIFPFAGAGALDWLESTTPEAVETPPPGEKAFVEEPILETPQPISPPFGNQMPDWLASADTVPAEAGALPPAPAPSGENLEMAQLPGWLQAMRPVEAVAPVTAAPVDDDRVEKSGPLAGLRGVLPGEEAPLQYRKPPVYSIKLRVTDANRQKASILDNMVKTESLAQALPPQETQVPQRIVRLMLGLALIAALFIPLMLGVPATMPAEVSQPGTPAFTVFSEVQSLTGGTVLVVVDYDAGFSGEMRTIALPVLQDLLQKPVNVALISTVPSGPILAEDLLTNAAQSQAGFARDARTANLGYLPGGVTAIRSFSSNPRQTVVIPMRSNQQGWNHAALKNINQLADFSQVILITESLDTARAWIEQTQDRLGNAPLLLIASAQLAPLAQPYVDSGQLRGMISGLAGGAAYAQIAQDTSSPAPRYYSAYQLGILVGIVVILVGAALETIASAFTRRKTPKEA